MPIIYVCSYCCNYYGVWGTSLKTETLDSADNKESLIPTKTRNCLQLTNSHINVFKKAKIMSRIVIQDLNFYCSFKET